MSLDEDNFNMGAELSIVHIEKTINAPTHQVYKAFQTSAALRIWYDPLARLTKSQVGGLLQCDNYPSAEVLVAIPHQTVVHRYTNIVQGTGVWSIITPDNGKTSRIILDHLDASDKKEERQSINFYWKGLIENLAAYCEGRETPFDHNAGQYKKEMKPKD